MTTNAFHLDEDGETWLQICPPDGRDWQEPIHGWSFIIELDTNAPTPIAHGVAFPASSFYQHTDGRQIPAV